MDLKTFESKPNGQPVDPNFAVEFIETHLQSDSNRDFETLFVESLRILAGAHGVTNVVGDNVLAQSAFCKEYSAKGNPRIRSLTRVLSAMGLELSIRKKTEKKAISRKKLLSRRKTTETRKTATK